MSSYTFKWEHPGSEVYVTGTFDDWKQTEKLDKKGEGHFEKTVYFPSGDKQIDYKFVVDGDWKTNPSLPQETDDKGNLNNVLRPSDLTSTAGFAGLSSAAPTSTTAGLAGPVPKEKRAVSDDVPGAFPVTPGFETPSAEPSSFSVNPIPASGGMGNPISLAPGEAIPKSLSTGKEEAAFGVNPIPASSGIGNPISLAPGEPVPSSIPTGGEEQAFGVKPIPASEGMGNPIHLAPGEPVPDPSTLSKHTISSTATTDKASYESGAGGLLAGGALLGGAGAAAGTGMFGVPPVTSGMIPESSLPMGGNMPADTEVTPFSSSAAPNSTTAALAGAVPKEPRGVPTEVLESQKAAHVDPEASANPEAVVEKKEVEAELLKKVPEAPAGESKTSGSSSAGGIAGTVAGAAAAAGAAVAAGAAAVKSSLPASVQKPLDNMNAKATDATTTPPTSSSTAPAASVPHPVADSIAAAHTSPEAAANPEAVREKSAMEAELEKKVKPVESSGEPAPTASAATTATAPKPTATETSATTGGYNTVTAAKLAPESATAASTAGGDVSPGTSTAALTEPTGAAAATTPAKKTITADTKDPFAKDGTTASPAGSSSTAAADEEQAKKDKKKKKRFSVLIEKIKKKFD